MTRPDLAGSTPFGRRLRLWRQHRGLSQLALALQVGSTSRHLSFLETGRSRPSRQMVLRLCEVLDVSLRERNELLHAAGLPAAYPEVPPADPHLSPYQDAMDRLLAAHEPYPAMVVDAHWQVLSANRAATALFGADLVGSSIVRRYLADPTAADVVANWAEVAWAGLARLQQQLGRSPFDDELRELVALTEHALAGVPRPETASSYVVCPWFRVGDQVIRTLGMVARFDPVTEVTLDELRIELMYPQDEAAEHFFRQLAAG